MTLDAVRAAILSDQPWARLDELVRAELAAGRLTHQIGDELQGMLDELQETPGLSENGDDALMETLESLFQMGPRKYWYENPPVLPTEEEIAALPRWARVAFAARCARRVLPLLTLDWNPVPAQIVDEAGLVVEMTEKFAQRAVVPDAQLAHQFEVAINNYNLPGSPSAAVAVVASIKAALSSYNAGPDAGLAASYGAISFNKHDLRLSLRRDFDHLARLSKWRHWTDDTPVPPEVFGPLWPEGPPPRWPAGPELPQRTELSLDLLALEQLSPAVLADEAAFLFNALNRYYIARTGDRLTLEGDVHTLLSALVPAGV